ncbi:MAG: hypothetical protein M0C28_05150 [Candidatus Moduliflexus flocculans]|nr:hypothetical protein [Candidatus Moduliflexus flocculans]
MIDPRGRRGVGPGYSSIPVRAVQETSHRNRAVVASRPCASHSPLPGPPGKGRFALRRARSHRGRFGAAVRTGMASLASVPISPSAPAGPSTDLAALVSSLRAGSGPGVAVLADPARSPSAFAEASGTSGLPSIPRGPRQERARLPSAAAPLPA